jgi:hypothetical protein
MIRRHASALIALCSLSALACSSTSTNEGDPSGSGGKGSGGETSSGGSAATGGAKAAGGTAATGGATGECDDSALASASTVCKPDADPCGLNSGYPGDEYCILPPPDGKGIQIHFGPSDYTNAAEVAKYLIHPGEEFNAYGLATIPGAGEHYYNYTQIRMRPGSHHLINQMVQGTEDMPDGFILDGNGKPKMGCPGSPVGGFPGTQNLVRNMPPGGQLAPENQGMGSLLRADTRLCVNHHAYNFGSDASQLREVWINIWFVPAEEVTIKTIPTFIMAGPFQPIDPYSQKVLTASATVAGEGRIVNLFGHRHAWTTRFAVWKNEDLVYDSWDWQESIAFDYDSITENPPLNPDAQKDGAVSGELPIKTGDKISIECDIDNQSENTLTFRNELYTGEMCILFGASVGTGIGNLPRGTSGG